MPKNVHTVTLPDGQVATRKSQNRVYTHAVAFRRSYRYAAEQAQREFSYMRSDFRHYSDLAHGRKSYPHIGDANANVNKGFEGLRGYIVEEDYVQNEIARAVEKVEKLRREGYYDKWAVEGWCGRADLAEKLAAQVNNKDSVRAVMVLDAQMEVK